MAIDLSTKGVNATSALQAVYQELMASDCPQQMCRDILEAVMGAGLKGTNLEKVMLALIDMQKKWVDQPDKHLARLRSYVTNYVLAGSGMAVNAGKYGR